MKTGFVRRYHFSDDGKITGIWLGIWRLYISFAYTASIGGNTMRETTFKITWRHPDREH